MRDRSPIVSPLRLRYCPGEAPEEPPQRMWFKKTARLHILTLILRDRVSIVPPQKVAKQITAFGHYLYQKIPGNNSEPLWGWLESLDRS